MTTWCKCDFAIIRCTNNTELVFSFCNRTNLLHNCLINNGTNIEEAVTVINNMQSDIKQYDTAFYNINARKIELEQELTIVNKSVLDLTHELKYLKMQINTINNQTNTRQY